MGFVDKIKLRLTRPSNDAFIQQVASEIIKANEPLAAMLARRGGSDQVGRDWANPAFGNFYATNVHVYRAVKLRADAVGSARLKVWKTDRAGKREWVGDDHPIQQALDKVNPFWSGVQMWRAVETYLSLWGSSFRWIDKTKANPKDWEMWVLRPDKMVVVRDSQTGPTNQYIKGFVYDPAGANFPMLPDEVIWDRYFNPLEEFAGMSPIAPSKLAIEMQGDMMSTNRDLFRNGMLTSNLAFFMKGPLQSWQIETFQERVAERHSGRGNSNKPIVVDLGLGDVKNMGFSNKEMEFLEGIQLTKEFIETTYGVPDELIAGARHATFANRAEARKEFYESTITQEWVLLESNMQEQYAPMLRGLDQRLIIAFDRDEVPALQENVNARSERHLKEVTAGVRTIEEYRDGSELMGSPEGTLLLPSSSRPVLINGGEIAAPPADGPPKMLKAVEESEITDLDRATWGLFIKRFDESEKEFHNLMDRLFEQQREETLRNLSRAVRATRGVRQNSMIERAGPQDIFDEGAWVTTFIEVGRPVFADSLELGGVAQVQEFGLGISFDINNAVTQAWLDERTKFWANHVNTETAKLITEEISAGIFEGEGVKALQVRVNNVFDFSEAFRSERIARTEATSASNQGHLEAYRQADVPSKRWLTALDGRQRDSHDAAHGQTVPIGQSFIVGGAEMMMPGQGPVEETANCRCSSLPIFKDDEDKAQIVLAEPYDDTAIRELLSGLEQDVGLMNRRPKRVIKTVSYDQAGLPVSVEEIHDV